MDSSDFLKIVITYPSEIKDEAEKITWLLNAGIDLIHIKKPKATERDTINMLEDIPYKFRKRLKLHGHFDLLNDFSLGGVHLNSRCPAAPSIALSVSKSIHSLEDLENNSGFAYVTLSPIFNSISKPGYNSKFNISDLKSKIRGKNVIALGGVTPKHLPELKEAGFLGAAMMGAIWSDFDKFITEW